MSAGAAREPDAAETHLLLGQLALDRGEPDAALPWFEAAAREGSAVGFNMLGRAAERGWGRAPDPAAAARYYRHAAERGDVWALFNLADLHCRGHGVPRDDGAAYALYLEAARRGHLKSLNMLGLFHEAGRACPPDRTGARELFAAAARGGDCWGCFNLGRLLVEDGAVAAAIPWFERGLATGFPDFFRAVADALAHHPDARLAAVAASARRRAGEAAA